MDSEEIQKIKEIQDSMSSKYKEGSKIQSMSFASYNVPQFKEKMYKEWINCGPDNLWPNYLMHLVNNCGIHKRILDSKARQIAGKGLTIEDSQDKEQVANIEEFLKRNRFNKKTLKRIAIDQQTFGYWFLGIKWSDDRRTIEKFYHIDAASLRVGVPNKERQVTHFYWSEDWTNYRRKEFLPEKIAIFDTEERIEKDQLLMVRGYAPLNRFYALPSYVGCIDAIESYYELGSHVLNNTKNGLSPSLNISFNNGEPTEEERELIYRTINALYKGSKNAGKYILSFNKSKENATTIEPIQVSNMSEVYTAIKEKCQSDIVIGHGLTSPVLAGIPIPGQIGDSAGEIATASESFYNELIIPAQLEIQEVIQEILEINGFTLKVFIQEAKPITYRFDDSTLMSIMTADELRHKINLPPLSDADRTNLAINLGKPKVEPKVDTTVPVAEGMADDSASPLTNSALRGLTPQENSDMYRIVRDFTKGKLNEHLALARIMAYGIDEETAKKILGMGEEEMNIETPGLKPYVNELPKYKKNK